MGWLSSTLRASGECDAVEFEEALRAPVPIIGDGPSSEEPQTAIPVQKGLAFTRKPSIAVRARQVRPEEIYGREPSEPRCLEANGGVAVVAA